MRTITVNTLSEEAFAKYGSFMNLLDNEAMKKKSIFSSGFFADLISLDFSDGTLPTISVCDVHKKEKNIVDFLEAHTSTCEGLLPLDGDVVIFAGIPNQPFSAEDLEAFYVPAGTFIKLNPLIVHGTQYPVSEGEVHVVCMLPGRTFHNDMVSYRLTEEEQAVVVME
ncbi:ureidoglycolate lyase [Novisyntrophococcus fermenticellae]|uniref:ureidoglycolate lyase n=1 Tax=Novisyntrophococcus fermenticellae TaxID=2068655 RepID=UPI001E60601E|nr:ureidoglycolate lyase [Novisyntrophococcus fermenticellae]